MTPQQLQWNRIGSPPDQLGVGCDHEGPSIGPIRLLKRTSTGFEPRDKHELNFVFGRAFGSVQDFSAKQRALKSVAAALETGDLARATLLTPFMHLSPLPDKDALRHAITADCLAKAGFNSDQPRDSDGRWTANESGYSSEEAASVRDPAGFQDASLTCTDCHSVVPPVPPVWQGPFDDFLFGPQPIRPHSPDDHEHNKALEECYAMCSEEYVQRKLGRARGARGSDEFSNYRICMRDCMEAHGQENF